MEKMFSIKKILESRKFREQEPFNRKIVVGQVSITTGDCRAARPEQLKRQSAEQTSQDRKKRIA